MILARRNVYIYTCVKITRMGDKNYASVSGARVAINCKYLFHHREDPIYRYLIKSPKILRSDVTGFRNRWKFLLSSFHDSLPKILTPTVAKTHTYSNAFLEESSLHFLHTSLTHDFSSWKKKKKEPSITRLLPTNSAKKRATVKLELLRGY